MAALVTQEVPNNGLVPTFANASGGAGDTAEIGGGGNFLVLKNTSAGTVTYTITVPGNTFFGLANPDHAVSVIAGDTKYVPLRKEYDDGTGRATVVLTTGTPGSTIQIAVVRVS